jgi:two-component system, sensor histidine kinase LadS
VDILLVDDNPLMQQLMVRFLSELGYSVAVAGRADEAIELARVEAPLLFVLDMHLPDRDGPEALEALRALPGCAATPALAISGMDESAIRPLLGPGFVAYLSKPIDLDRFESLVAHQVNDRKERSV